MNGKIYVPGGDQSGSVLFGKMQIYTISTKTWSVDPQVMPSGREAQSAVCTAGSKSRDGAS